jgi:uncharacterized protein (DUF305 family)
MRNRSVLWGVVCITTGVVIAIAVSLAWGLGAWGPGDEARAGVSTTMERHFLEQMIPHHEDAVAMAEVALTRAEHPELRQLAETIIRDQTREIEQMRAWYLAWYGVEAPSYGRDDRRGWMGGGPMMGGMMNDSADLEILETAPVFDREFIEQLIPHHQMGVMMARMVMSRSDRPEIEDLARAIITTQTAEIKQMRDWYQIWFDQREDPK